MERLPNSIKSLESLVKTTKSLDKAVLRDCLVLLKLFKKEDLFDGYIHTTGMMTGGFSVQWVLDYRGNTATKHVTLRYEKPGTVKIESNSLDKAALQIINTVGLFFRLKEEAKKKAKADDQAESKSPRATERPKGQHLGSLSPDDTIFLPPYAV